MEATGAEVQGYIIIAIGFALGLFLFRRVRGRWGLGIGLIVCLACNNSSAQTFDARFFASVQFRMKGSSSIVNPTGSLVSSVWYLPPGNARATTPITFGSQAAMEQENVDGYVPLVKFGSGPDSYYMGVCDFLYAGDRALDNIRVFGCLVTADHDDVRLFIALNFGEWKEIKTGNPIGMTQSAGIGAGYLFMVNADGTIPAEISATFQATTLAGYFAVIGVELEAGTPTTQATTQPTTQPGTPGGGDVDTSETDMPWLTDAERLMMGGYDSDLFNHEGVIAKVKDDWYLTGSYNDALTYFTAVFSGSGGASSGPHLEIIDAMKELHADAGDELSEGSGVDGQARSTFNTLILDPSTGIFIKLVEGVVSLQATYPLLMTIIQACGSAMILWTVLLNCLELIVWAFGGDISKGMDFFHLESREPVLMAVERDEAWPPEEDDDDN